MVARAGGVALSSLSAMACARPHEDRIRVCVYIRESMGVESERAQHPREGGKAVDL